MREGLTSLLRRIYWWLTQWGFDPRRTVRALGGLGFFLRDYFAFRRGYSGRMQLLPSLHDRGAAAGSVDSEYFQQDLYVAQRICAARPRRHLDVGSRLDGFVAHVAAFREIEIMDIRPLQQEVASVRFVQADLMSESLPLRECCDSLSCLHALEHFGLGRYGDPIDPRGHERGLRNLALLLQPGGRLYLAVPVGRERVEFNSHRVFDPRTIVQLSLSHALVLKELAWVAPHQALATASDHGAALQQLAQLDYALGIFTFDKS